MSEKSRIVNFSAATFVLAWCAIMPLCYIFYSNFIRETPQYVYEENKPKEVTSAPVVNNFAPAVEAAQKEAQTNPSYQAYLNLGLVYYQSGKFKESIEATKKAIEYNANRAAAYNNLAAAYGALEQWDLEIEACKKALEIEPDLQLAKNNLAWALSQKQKLVSK